MQEMWVQFLGWEDPLENKWQPTPVFLPKKAHGQREEPDGLQSLGLKESDTTLPVKSSKMFLVCLFLSEKITCEDKLHFPQSSAACIQIKLYCFHWS